jgi:hypothetical protein
MAHDQEGPRLPAKAASAIAQYVPVTGVPAGSSLSETVYRAGSVNDFPLGFTTATVASPGDEVSIQNGGVTKGVAGASMGAWTPVAVGSTNGILIPLVPSGLSTALGSAIGAQGVRWSVGVTTKNAVAGDHRAGLDQARPDHLAAPTRLREPAGS